MDGGGLLFGSAYLEGNPQAELLTERARLVARSLTRSGVAAVNVGRPDLAAGVTYVEALGKEAGVPWVSASLKLKGGGHPFPRWKVLSWGEAKVALFGLMAPERDRDAQLGVEVADPETVAASVLRELPAVDAVICLSNLGLSKEIDLAKRVRGITVIVGGGSAELLSSPLVVDNTVILHASEKGKYLGVLDLPRAGLGAAWTSPKDVQEKLALEARIVGARAEIAALGGGTEAQLLARAKDDALLARRIQAAFRSLEASQKGLADWERNASLFSHRVQALDGSVGEDPEILSWVKGYKSFETAWYQRTPATQPRESPARPSGAGPAHTGSVACRACHPDEYRLWLSTAHSRSYLALRGKEQEKGCTECHLSALQRVGGPVMEPAVACEVCHGPGGNHQSRGNIARKPPGQLCRRCHRGFHEGERFDLKSAYDRIRCDRQ